MQVYLHPLLEEFLALKFMHAAVTMQHVKRLETVERKKFSKISAQVLVLNKITTECPFQNFYLDNNNKNRIK
jgi:hypothetical protein